MSPQRFQPMLISEEEAREHFEYHFPSIRGAIEEGFFEVANLAITHPNMYAVMKSRTRASLVFDWIIHKANRNFVDSKSVQVIERRGLILFVINEIILLRFAKLGPRLLPSRAKTFQKEMFEYNLPLPGVEPATYFTAGYVTDALGTKVESMHIVHQQGKDLVYAIPLLGETIAQMDAGVMHLEQVEEIRQSRVISTKRKLAEQEAKANPDQDVKTSGE